MISVYDIGNDYFDWNGNAVLTPTEARMKCAAGGNYDLSMTHPIDPDGKWQHLVPGAVLRIPVPREEIENAYAGYDADVYKTTVNAELREGPSEPTVINYSAWVEAGAYQVGSNVTFGNQNFVCNYYDRSSITAHVIPPNSAWWTEIARYTAGSPVMVTLPAGTELYLVEDYNTDWYKMSTYYGIVGYVKKSVVTYDRHLTPSETQPRIITTQLMRITNATVDSKARTVSVTAQHISYDLNGIIVDDVALNQASPGMALGRISEAFMIPYKGTIATNITQGTYTDNIKGKTGMFCLLDPDKGIVSAFDAAFKRDNWDLFIMQRTAQNRGFRLKYRKNMIGVNWAKKSDSLITRIVPVAKNENGDDLLLPEKWVDSTHINDYPIIRMERLSVAGQVGKDKGAGDGSTWTESELLDEMRAKAAEQFTVYKVDVVLQDVTVDFEMIGNTAEYAWMKDMESVLLYDTVSVENEEIGLDMDLTVTELEWDAIKEKIVALKLSNANEKTGRNVTGYNVQAKSIGPSKLTDDVAVEIINQVKDILPEYADPEAERPSSNVVDDLTSTSATDALSANQGRVLKEMIEKMPVEQASTSVKTYTASLSNEMFTVFSAAAGTTDNPTTSGSYLYFIWRDADSATVIGSRLGNNSIYIASVTGLNTTPSWTAWQSVNLT